jgi:hypothetical protein
LSAGALSPAGALAAAAASGAGLARWAKTGIAANQRVSATDKCKFLGLIWKFNLAGDDDAI